MDTFRNFCLMLVFMIGSALLFKKGSSYIDESKQLSISYDKYLSNCASKLDQSCGNDIFTAVFIGNHTVSIDCCIKLAKVVGKSCHNDLTNFGLHQAEYKKNNEQISQRSQKVFNGCEYSATWYCLFYPCWIVRRICTTKKLH